MSKKKDDKVSYKVIQAFKDKNTLDVYAIGDFYEADAKRLKELQSKGFIEKEEEEEEKKDEKS